LRQRQELVIDQRQIRREVDRLCRLPRDAVDPKTLELASHDGCVAFVLDGDDCLTPAQRK